jgi:hypothetical protein
MLAGRAGSASIDQVEPVDVAINAVLGMVMIVLSPIVVRKMAGAEWYQFGIHLSHWARAVGWGAVAFFLITPVVHLAYFLATRYYEPQPHPVETLLREAPTAGNIALVLWSAAVVAPLAEELLFRGILFGWMRRTLGWRFALIASSLLFALLHVGQWPTPIPLFVLALGLGYSYHRTNSLAAPVTLHVLFNGSSLMQLFLSWI